MASWTLNRLRPEHPGMLILKKTPGGSEHSHEDKEEIHCV